MEDSRPNPEPAADVAATSKFRVPTKEVKSPMQVGKWQKSSAFADVVGFISKANEKIRGRSLTCKREPSENVRKTLSFLDTCLAWIRDIPPQTQAQRFGNKAFRTWLQKTQEGMIEFHEDLVGAELKAQGAVQEVSLYFGESFGNITRIDYGTGHELNFVAWLAALLKLDVFKEEDIVCMIFDVFVRYLVLMRELQGVYWLEPAGSKGVWGLDDYQFLPLLWGAAQFDGQDDIKPSDIHNKDLVKTEAENYMYLACIAFINKMKTGPFGEHSCLLNDISAVPTWSKVNAGLIKMFDKEVLGKFPVVQHFFFGSILSMDECPADHPSRQPRDKRPPRAKFTL